MNHLSTFISHYFNAVENIFLNKLLMPFRSNHLVLSTVNFFLVCIFFNSVVIAQTNPAAQMIPYSQDFSGLAHNSTTYPSGWQGWTLAGSASSAFRTNAPTLDRALIMGSSASNNSGGVHNYNGKIGLLSSGSVDPSLVVAINTTSATNVGITYDIMTIRNPYDGGSNTRINEVTLQYRIGTSSSFTNLTGYEYQNNTTLQTGSGVTTPQKLETKMIPLPSACDNQAVVQLRWALRDVSGSGGRPSFAIDNFSTGESEPPLEPCEGDAGDAQVIFIDQVAQLNASGGSGQWSGGLGSFSNISDPNATYTPDISEVNTSVELTWTVSSSSNMYTGNVTIGVAMAPLDCEEASYTTNVVVFANPDAEFFFDPDMICIQDASETPQHSTGVDGVYTYSGAGNLAIDPNTGTIDVGDSESGMYTVTNTVSACGNLIISGIIDGPLFGGVPKAVELYAIGDIGNLGQYSIVAFYNGSTTGIEMQLPNIALAAGERYYISSFDQSGAAAFTDYFGFAPDFVNNVVRVNGDDAVGIACNGVVYDVFGEIGVDGSGEAWEYLDGWAYRNSEDQPNGGKFNPDAWTFSGPNAIDGQTTNNNMVSSMPIGTFSTMANSVADDVQTFDITILDLLCGWSAQANGVNCNEGNSVSYNSTTQVFTVTSTNCYYANPFNSDSHAFAQYELCGNGSITAQVTSISGALAWAGVTMRESNLPSRVTNDNYNNNYNNNAAGAKKAQLMTNLSNFSRREFRTTTNGSAYPQQFPSQNRYWLRIVRTGNQFVMYISPNNLSWFFAGAQNISMPSCIQIGLVVTNYNANSTATATFANVSVTGGMMRPVATEGVNPVEAVLDWADFNVSPNPTTGASRLDLSAYGNRHIQMEVINLQGQVMLSNRLSSNGYEDIDLSAYSNGMYLIRVRSEGLPDVTKRVVLSNR